MRCQCERCLASIFLDVGFGVSRQVGEKSASRKITSAGTSRCPEEDPPVDRSHVCLATHSSKRINLHARSSARRIRTLLRAAREPVDRALEERCKGRPRASRHRFEDYRFRKRSARPPPPPSHVGILETARRGRFPFLRLPFPVSTRFRVRRHVLTTVFNVGGGQREGFRSRRARSPRNRRICRKKETKKEERRNCRTSRTDPADRWEFVRVVGATTPEKRRARERSPRVPFESGR